MIVGAYNDAYVSQKSVRELAQHWPGSQVPDCPSSLQSAVTPHAKSHFVTTLNMPEHPSSHS